MGYWCFHASQGLLIACSTTSVDVLRASRMLPHLFYASVAYGYMYSLAPLQHWLLCSATMSSPCTLYTGREEQEVSVDQFIPIYARPLDYTAMVPATNTVLRCELCTLACYLIHSYIILNPNCVILSLELPKSPMKVKQLLYSAGIFLVTTMLCKVCDCIVVFLPLIVDFVVKIWKWFSYELLRLRQCINYTATILLVEQLVD